MEKKPFFGETLKERLKAGARDRLFNFMLADGRLRGAIVHGTRMIGEMRANHELGILETMVLGRAYLGSALMTADLKGQDRIRLNIDCSGPIQGLTVEANAFGEVRGFLKNVPIPLAQPLESFDLASFFGRGILSVTRHIQGARRPDEGRVKLTYGNIAKDLAHYHLTCRQLPTAINLSVKFDRIGSITGAGGLALQALPDADDRVLCELEERFTRLPSVGAQFSGDTDPQDFIRHHFNDYGPEITSNRRIEFMCHCNRDRLSEMLALLPVDELEDILAKGPFPMTVRCHYCNSAYEFGRSELQRIHDRRSTNNPLRR